ncbi:putative membrane protein YfcA [Rhodococcus sp. SORGH_AS303]|nr:putative membrane protein YfcA [Rhodococcus sp. SORGH_AS_0301]MDQ1201787.1 putative membrane protein YfcA [Rhodococcus sp. SORGH_AS_0303]
MSAMGAGDWSVLLAAALAAGWVDAVVGGGGLILLPALLLVTPAATTQQTVLATNKLASVAGTTAAVLTFSRKVPMNWRLLAPAGVVAAVGAAFGAATVSLIDKDLFIPIVLVVLVGVAVLVTLRPTVGVVVGDPPTRRRITIVVVVAAVAIGFYDGILGPGTGTFLIITFATLLGTEFVRSAAMAKVLNLGSNIGALLYFSATDDVLWLLGLAMAVANVAGSLVGSRMAISRGAGFVRIVLLVVVFALVIRLGWQQFG